MNATERAERIEGIVVGEGRDPAIRLVAKEIRAAQREVIEKCVSIVDQFLGPGITILHVPRARANLIARLRALEN